MDSIENFVKINEELSEWRTKLSYANKSEEKDIPVLKELNNLGMTITQALKDSDKVAKKICNETNQYELEYNNTLYVGSDSVKHLVELKRTASDLFADVRKNNSKEFKEKLNYEPLYKDLENMEKAQAKSQEFLKYMELSLEGLQAIFNAKHQEDRCKPDSEVLSANRTDPSAVGFSLFENSATNAATSSPFANI